MKSKEKIITIIISSIILCIYFVVNSYSFIDDNVNKIYNVYLDGEKIGVIEDKKALYNLIDKKQMDIKNKYNVESVFPPNSLEIVENYSYNSKVDNLNKIYDKIEEMQDFTIMGYEITVTNSKEKKEFKINVLDKEIFNNAIEKFILAFIDKEDYNNYLNGTQKELKDVGINYTNMDIRRAHNPKVVGSNPASATMLNVHNGLNRYEHSFLCTLVFGAGFTCSFLLCRQDFWYIRNCHTLSCILR